MEVAVKTQKRKKKNKKKFIKNCPRGGQEKVWYPQEPQPGEKKRFRSFPRGETPDNIRWTCCEN